MCCLLLIFGVGQNFLTTFSSASSTRKTNKFFTRTFTNKYYSLGIALRSLLMTLLAIVVNIMSRVSSPALGPTQLIH